MKGLSKETFFFFNEDLSHLEIKPNSLHHAYLSILQNDLKSAEIIFSHIDSPRAKWGKVLVSILNGYMSEFPTYFSIRNFLEIDIEFLLKNNKIDYVELCLGALDILSNINQETYKFAARVMLENKLYSSALKYLEQSKQIYYKDPELHFMLAKYYINTNNPKEALFYINECLTLLPDYYPALMIKERLAFL